MLNGWKSILEFRTHNSDFIQCNIYIYIIYIIIYIPEDLGHSLLHVSPAELPTYNNRKKGDYLIYIYTSNNILYDMYIINIYIYIYNIHIIQNIIWYIYINLPLATSNTQGEDTEVVLGVVYAYLSLMLQRGGWLGVKKQLSIINPMTHVEMWSLSPWKES